MEEKKTKKTLTISSKKAFSVPDFQKNSQKKSFIIEKTASRNKNERRFVSRNDSTNKTDSGFKKEPFRTSKFSSGAPSLNKSVEIRKKAEENAKKRFKSFGKSEESHSKKSSLVKSKSSISTREVKFLGFGSKKLAISPSPLPFVPWQLTHPYSK